MLVSFEQLPDRLEGRETWKHRVITRIEIADNWAGLVGSDLRMIKLWFNYKGNHLTFIRLESAFKRGMKSLSTLEEYMILIFFGKDVIN